MALGTITQIKARFLKRNVDEIAITKRKIYQENVNIVFNPETIYS